MNSERSSRGSTPAPMPGNPLSALDRSERNATDLPHARLRRRVRGKVRLRGTEAIRFRCPYCKRVFTPQISPLCPGCGRAMNIPCKYHKFERDGNNREGELASTGSASTPFGGIFGFLAGRPRYIPIFGSAMIILAVVFLSVGRERPVFAFRQVDPPAIAAENLQTLQTALELFRHDCGRYPTTSETLRVLKDDVGISGWRGPYIYNLTRDPWHRSFLYSLQTGTVSLCSSGPDRIFGTPDDIQAPPADTGVVAQLIEERSAEPWTAKMVIVPKEPRKRPSAGPPATNDIKREVPSP